MVYVDSAPCPGAEGEDPGRGGRGRDEGPAGSTRAAGERTERELGEGGGAEEEERDKTVQCSDKTRLFVQLYVFIDASSG